MTPRDRGRGRATPSGASPGAASGAGGGRVVLRERLTEVIQPVIAKAGFDLERVSVSRVGRRFRVQVVVDHDDGVGLDAIAEVSRAVSTALDMADETGAAVVPAEYVLEVSSPGVDRPLTEPRHWRRNLGRLVTVAVADQGQVTGRVVAATAAGVTLEVEGTAQELPYQRLGTGRVQVELQRVNDEADEADEESAPEAVSGEGGT